jgi:hypothetical protein
VSHQHRLPPSCTGTARADAGPADSCSLLTARGVRRRELPRTRHPATQARRALGLPGPNDGIGDAARLRGLGVLLAAAEAAALSSSTRVFSATAAASATDDTREIARSALPGPAAEGWGARS